MPHPAPTLPSALAAAVALAAAALPGSARAFGEPERQVLIETVLVGIGHHDELLAGLGPFGPSQRLDAAAEAAADTAAGLAAEATAEVIAGIEGDAALAQTQDGGAALVMLSLSAAASQALDEVLAESGAPKAGKVGTRAREARGFQVAALSALLGRPTRFPLGERLPRDADAVWGALQAHFPFLLSLSLPADGGVLYEPFGGAPGRLLLERAGLVSGAGLRARVRGGRALLSLEARDPSAAALDLQLALPGSYTALVAFRLPEKLGRKRRDALSGFSAGLKVTSDASPDPAEAVLVEHQTTPDGWAQTFTATKAGVVETFPHGTADAARRITTFVVKDGTTVTVGGVLDDGAGRTLVESSIPVLGDLPVLGLFLRGTRRNELVADDLVVYVTPHLVADAGKSADGAD